MAKSTGRPMAGRCTLWLTRTKKILMVKTQDTGSYQVSSSDNLDTDFQLTSIASGVAYLTVQDSSVTKNAAHHTTHHLYVTRQKDNETYAVGAYNSLTPEDPQVDFDKYFNSESLDQEDM